MTPSRGSGGRFSTSGNGAQQTPFPVHHQGSRSAALQDVQQRETQTHVGDTEVLASAVQDGGARIAHPADAEVQNDLAETTFLASTPHTENALPACFHAHERHHGKREGTCTARIRSYTHSSFQPQRGRHQNARSRKHCGNMGMRNSPPPQEEQESTILHGLPFAPEKSRADKNSGLREKTCWKRRKCDVPVISITCGCHTSMRPEVLSKDIAFGRLRPRELKYIYHQQVGAVRHLCVSYIDRLRALRHTHTHHLFAYWLAACKFMIST